MEGYSMHKRILRGGAAALIAMTPFLPLAAQAGGGGAGARRQDRDSVIFRALTVGRMDTINVLFRALTREQYGSEPWRELMRKIDSLVTLSSGQITIRSSSGGGFGVAAPVSPLRGWVGLNAQGPSLQVRDTTYRVTYLAYPSILSVDPDSPADRAGIAPGDVLIAFNGTDVVGHEFNMTRMFVPEKKVGVTVRRDGENKDYSLEVMRAPEGVFNRRIELSRVPPPPYPEVTGGMRIEPDRPDGPRHPVVMAVPRAGRGGAMAGPLVAGGFMLMSSHGILGATMSAVGPDLAKALKLEKGMLVNEVPEQSPAYKSGLRAGDVIVSVSGQPVVTMSDLQDQLVARIGEHSLGMQVVRDKKPLKLTVTW